jgi:hypothetical protein
MEWKAKFGVESGFFPANTNNLGNIRTGKLIIPCQHHQFRQYSYRKANFSQSTPTI